jgi:uncharacterized radical SAM superfamily Fe-S cluster-containing enzyme
MTDSEQTQSLCPICLKRVSARREQQGDAVYLVKTCPDHGEFKTIIWQGLPAFDTWKRPKIPITPEVTYHQVDRGCPFDCGLCPDHRQRSCTIILEVTARCNLNCPVCYADSGRKSECDPTMDIIDRWYASAARAGSGSNIQLSGGEPTVRDDLPDIVRMGRQHGFGFIQINTNGLRLADDPSYTKALKNAGLDSIFLQFDGATDDIYRQIRGRDLLDKKMAAIEICGQNDIGVVLVPTLIPDINTNNIGSMLKTALKLSPTVRAIHFQPISYFGRFPEKTEPLKRLTLPELMRAIEKQSDGLFKASHFQPPGCENARCSFHANYIVESSSRVRLLSQPTGTCCTAEPEPADVGAVRSITRVARQWAAPKSEKTKVLPMAADQQPCCSQDGPQSLDDFLHMARSRTLSVSAMAFQDVWNIDLERLRDCCIHIMAPNGDIVPFCAYNLTGADGQRLYRL